MRLAWNAGRVFAVAVCLFGGLASSVQTDASPAENAWTGDNDQPLVTPASQMADFYYRQFSAYYEKFGEKDPAWDEAARHFITGFAAHLAYDESRDTPTPPGVPSLEALYLQRADLLERGVDDPLIIYLSAMINPTRYYDWTRQDHVHEEHAKQLARDAGEYHRMLPMFLATERFLAKREQDKGVSTRHYVSRTRIRLIEEYSDLFAADTELPAEDHEPLARLFEWLIHDLTSDDAQVLLAATREPPESLRWFALVLRGLIEYEHAWQVRGGGWAGSVEDGQWNRFGVRIDRAGEAFEAAWELDPNRAYAASWMIAVSRCRGDHQELVWFERATKADPNDPQPYDNWLTASRPRWGGDGEAMLRVGRSALEQGDFRTGVPKCFISALYWAQIDYGNGWIESRGEELWPDIQSFIQGQKPYPSPDQPTNWLISEGFWLARLTGHPEAMEQYMAELDHDVSRILGGHRYGLDNRWIPGEWATMADPVAAEAIREAESWAGKEESEKALQVLESALAKTDSPMITTHLKDRLTVLRWSEMYESGQWVELLEQGLSGWVLTRGQFTESESGFGVVGMFRSEQRGPGLRMICGLNPGPNFEAELEMTLPPGFMGFTWGGVGFILEPSIGRSSGSERMITIRRNLNNNLVWLQDPENPDDDDRMFGPAPNQALTDVTIRMQKWGHRVRLWVDGQLVIDEYAFFGDWPGTNSFALAGYHSDIDLDYKFNRLRIKRLDDSPFGAEAVYESTRDPAVESPHEVVPPKSPSTPTESESKPRDSKRPPYGR